MRAFTISGLFLLAGCVDHYPPPPPVVAGPSTYIPGPPYQRQPFNIRAVDVSVEMGQTMNILPLRGIYVIDVDTTGAAWTAGVRYGDVILTLGAHPINSISDMTLALNAQRPGSITRATIRRVEQGTVTEGPITIQF